MKINDNVIRWIRIGIEGAFIIVFVALCIAVGVKNKKIREIKQKEIDKSELIDSLTKRCEALGNMDCISISTTFVINNKTVLGINTTQANNVSRTYATYTKNEVIRALDSLSNINKNE